MALAAGAAVALFTCVPASQATFKGRNGKIAFDVEGRGVFATGPTGRGRRLLARRIDEEPAWSRRGRLAVQRHGRAGGECHPRGCFSPAHFRGGSLQRVVGSRGA